MSIRNGLALLALCLVAALFLTGCPGQDTVRLGAVLPLSGEWQNYGEVIRRGIDVGLAECQADEGAPAIQLEVLDSESNPERAKEVLGQEYSAGAWAVIGGVTTPEARAMVQVADEYNRVLLSPSASTPDLTGISRLFYRVWPSDYREGMKMGEYARQKINLETAVTLAAESEYAKGIQAVFASSFEQNGGQVLEAIEYPKDTQDFSALVDRVVELNPDAVYLADYADVLVEQIKLLSEKGFEGRVLTVSAFATQESITAAGEAGEGVYITHPPYDPSNPDTERLTNFVSTYEAQYGEKPDIYAAHGYDAMLVFCQALQKGADRPTNFWRGLRSLGDLQGATGILQFDEKGDVQKWPRVYLIVEGKAVDHEVWVKEQREILLRQYQQIQNERRELVSGSDG